MGLRYLLDDSMPVASVVPCDTRDLKFCLVIEVSIAELENDPNRVFKMSKECSG